MVPLVGGARGGTAVWWLHFNQAYSTVKGETFNSDTSTRIPDDMQSHPACGWIHCYFARTTSNISSVCFFSLLLSLSQNPGGEDVLMHLALPRPYHSLITSNLAQASARNLCPDLGPWSLDSPVRPEMTLTLTLVDYQITSCFSVLD